MSRLPPSLARRDRPQPAGRLGRNGRLGHRIGDGPAGGRDRLLPFADRRQQLVRRRDADDSRERVLGHGDAGQLRRPRKPAVEVPRHHVRLGEQVGEEPEPGDDGRDAEVRRLVGEELDLEDVARLRSLDMHRPAERVAEPEVEPPCVSMRARPGQLPREAVLALEPHLVAGRDVERRLELGVPAVVHHSRRASSFAARRHASASSCVHRRGAFNSCTERIAATSPRDSTAVTI